MLCHPKTVRINKRSADPNSLQEFTLFSATKWKMCAKPMTDRSGTPAATTTATATTEPTNNRASSSNKNNNNGASRAHTKAELTVNTNTCVRHIRKSRRGERDWRLGKKEVVRIVNRPKTTPPHSFGPIESTSSVCVNLSCLRRCQRLCRSGTLCLWLPHQHSKLQEKKSRKTARQFWKCSTFYLIPIKCDLAGQR